MRTLRAIGLICLAAACGLRAQGLPHAAPSELKLDGDKLGEARDYALSGGGSGLILRGGKVALEWGDQRQLYDLKSTTKSFGATTLALAIADGKLTLETRAAECVPGFGTPPAENRLTGWLQQVTLFHLATHTAGFQKPGGYEAIVFQPGTKWSYSDGGPNWLADCVTRTYGRDIQELMFERVFEPIGIGRDDLRWRRNQYRTHEMDGVARREFGSGVHANVEAMARLGLLYLGRGKWQGRRILPADFVEQASRPLAQLAGLEVVDAERHPGASKHYGLLWWNNGDGAIRGLPRDAFWSWGLFDSLIVVIPSLDMVVARAGKSFAGDWDGSYDKLVGFLTPVAQAAGAPYEASDAITGVEWAAANTIRRRAEGGDNWPLTWGADGTLYTAYGDGWGFEPKTEIKLSMGLAKVTGGPADFVGVNIRSETGERIGHGPKGEKASGILMVDGVLYLWLRNAGNAKLGWSTDEGKTWEFADWRLRESFGAPAFLNFGKNYEGARDEYVYVYSHDAGSAYDAADGLVLARVRKDRVREREAYEFFAGAEGEAGWSADVGERRHVMRNPGRAYRTQVSYNSGLKRYLACQINADEDTRFEGGFGVYDAPEPWGPWTTVYFTRKWDVGPGETCGFPTKWMSADGKTLQMVFSGDDSFSVREATLRVR